MGVYIANISFVIYNYNSSVLKFIYFLGLDAENIYRFTKRSKTLLTITAFVSLPIRQPALQALRVCAGPHATMVSSFLIWQASTHLSEYVRFRSFLCILFSFL